MNGGSLMAMAGHECVALAVDKRFGSGPQMVNIAPRHVWAAHPNLMLAFSGLEGDVQSLAEELKMEVDAKRNRALGFSIGGLKSVTDGRNNEMGDRRSRISPSALACLTSHVLYKKRGYYVEPLVVGLMEKTRKPFLCAMDMIGAQSFSDSFICSGAASTSLYGTAEALWKPNMKPKDLLECCGKVFQSGECMNNYKDLCRKFDKSQLDIPHQLLFFYCYFRFSKALERDCLSGYGILIYLISKDGIAEYDLASRND